MAVNSDDAVHKRAMTRFDAVSSQQSEQRDGSLAARRFATIPGAQWEGEWGTAFENAPRFEVNKIAPAVDKIETDYRNNRIMPDFRPAAGRGEQATADTLDGLHRADSQRYKAQSGRDNAFSEAVLGGMGAYRLVPQLEDPYDTDSDAQRINPAATIVDADQRVFFDPDSKEYDKRDAKWCFLLTSMSADAFEEEYPDATDDFPQGATRPKFDWFAPDVRIVAEYWEVRETKGEMLILTNRLTGDERRRWRDDLEDGELSALRSLGWRSRTSKRSRRQVVKYTLSGAEVIEDHGRIAGDQIPVVPVYGKRWYVDNQERWRGHVQLKMDSQRIYNSRVSKLAETDALAPREVPIFDPEQMPPEIATHWRDMNINRSAYALALALRNPDGSIASLGPIGKIDPPQVAPVTGTLLQIASADLVADDADGADTAKANTSADAMDIAATRVDAKSGIYLDNMRQSVEREGEIYLSMVADVYGEEDRVVEIMSEDGDDGTAKLKESFTDKAGKNVTRNDFTAGRYKVIASVQEATATRRDKTVRMMLNLAGVAQQAGDQELARAALITAVVNSDGEGVNDFQAWARKLALSMGLVQPNEEEQKALGEAEQNAQPDPAAQVAEAQAKALLAGAEKDVALATKAGADTKLAEARATDILADAHVKGQQPPPMPSPLRIVSPTAGA